MFHSYYYISCFLSCFDILVSLDNFCAIYKLASLAQFEAAFHILSRHNGTLSLPFFLWRAVVNGRPCFFLRLEGVCAPLGYQF